jgi:hypothetical protein
MKLLPGDAWGLPIRGISSARACSACPSSRAMGSPSRFLVVFGSGQNELAPPQEPQVLLVKEGRGLVQKWGEPVQEIGEGDAITIEPHEKHWHGAAPGTRMAHFAVNLNLTTEWLEPVSDDQYRAS